MYQGSGFGALLYVPWVPEWFSFMKMITSLKHVSYDILVMTTTGNTFSEVFEILLVFLYWHLSYGVVVLIFSLLALVVFMPEFFLNRHEPPVTAETIEIISETDDMVVVNKPSSIPV